MSLTQEEWEELSALDANALKSRVFSILQQAAFDIQENDPDDPKTLNVVPRLADLLEKRPELESYKEVFSTLARSVGLWNYIDKSVADARDEILAEAVTIPELDGITLHREQVNALNALLSGKNLVLSAPTSFGKSILIDALIASGKFRRIAIVLPTIALLDEFRRRLSRRFANKFTIVMYHSQAAPTKDVIFLGTQERLINRTDLGRLDLAIVDEFYKLDPTRQDDRSLTLNAAVYQLLRRSNQFFFLGPNIETVRLSADSRWRFEFLRTRFSTVAVDTFDLRNIDDKDARLKEEIRNTKNWPALVFASAPDRANSLAEELASSGPALGEGSEFANWIDENFGAGWKLREIVAAGIGVHHGRIPRAVASHFVRHFNSGAMPVLICTSTLIEGVNTAAKSVLIYDKTINKQDYDFFTFSNIKGRAGRLGEHHVGSVYLFHTPPAQEDVEVEPPLFGDMDNAPDELVVHISDEDASPRISDRVQLIAKKMELAPDELKLASSVGLDEALELKRYTEEASRSGQQIHWAGYPDYKSIGAICEIICEIRNARNFGVYSAKQLTYFLHSLRISQSMRVFFRNYTSSYKGEPTNQDNVFKFLRACEYGLPQFFSVIELFAKRIKPETNYSLFVAEMPRWFRPEILKNLDEQGVPIQISERFYSNGDTIDTLSERLFLAASGNDRSLSTFEKNWILEAIAPPSQLFN